MGPVLLSGSIPCGSEPVGAKLARDEDAWICQWTALSFVASKLCSHRVCSNILFSESFP
ncbi:hypothetical protein SAMN03159297_02847 [Pseudomonas sp. NFACC45]|nr:hypothetical protein SAMN03159297_02847 [Pseudomonas sp. NFACC45]